MDKKINDIAIKCEFKASELFQINLSIISRSSFATLKWASATNAEEQKQMQSEILYLNELNRKIEEILNEAKL